MNFFFPQCGAGWVGDFISLMGGETVVVALGCGAGAGPGEGEWNIPLNWSCWKFMVRINCC